MKKMLEKFKKSKSSIALVILALVLIIAGISFALFSPSINLLGRRNIKISKCELDINFKESDELMLVSKYPIKDSEALKLKAKDVVITNNSTCDTAYYKLTIKDLNNSSINKSKIKFQLVDKTSGDTTNSSNPDTFLVEDSLTNGDSKSYSIRLWIDESATNADLYENGDTTKPIEYKYALNLEAYDEKVDDSVPNAPELTSNMIPVYYDESSKVWRKADSTNKNNSWYDYNNKMWANAVTISTKGPVESVTENTTVSLETTSKYVATLSSSSDSNNVAMGGNVYSSYTIDQSTGEFVLSDALVASSSNYNALSGYYICSTYTTSNVCPGLFKLVTYTSTSPMQGTRYIYSGETYTTTQQIAKKYVASNYQFANSKFKLVSPTLETYSSSSVGKYTCDSETLSECTTMYKVKTAEENKVTKADKYQVGSGYVSSSNKYDNASVGTEISMDDISTMWVWIPRYTYTMLNTCASIKNPTEEANPSCYGYVYKDEYHDDLVNDLVNNCVSDESEAEEIITSWKSGEADDYLEETFAGYANPDNGYTELTFDKTFISTNVSEQSFDIKFESGTSSSGTIKCTDNVTGTSSTSETCTDTTNNGLKAGISTYTHPAFTFGDKELTGIWVGKFEISSGQIIKPNVTSLRNQTVNQLYTGIYNMRNSGNVFGFATTDETHMIKNMEWGAVAYLSHSKYGINKEITTNNCSKYITGIGADTVSASSSSATCTTDKNKYNGASGAKASTTGNVYGIYDMSGGAFEYVMGNMVNSSGSFYSAGAGFSTAPATKYYDKYSYGTTYYDKAAYSKGKLGDATKEISSTSLGGYSWYSDYAGFPLSSASWFVRGGYYANGARAGAFYFDNNNGNANSGSSSRAVLLGALD